MKQFSEFINESLMTHDGNILLKKLLEKFKDDIIFYKTNNEVKNNVVILLVVKNIFKDENSIIVNNDFKKLLNFFNYEISCYGFISENKIKISNNQDPLIQYQLMCDWAIISKKELRKTKSDNYLLCLEPIYSKNVNDYVYNDCNGIIYKVINNDKIKNSGLKLSTRNTVISKLSSTQFGMSPEYLDLLNKSGWHTWTNRQYFIAAKNKNELIKSLDYIKNERLYFNDAYLIKVDLKKHNLNLNFYQDVFLKDKNAIYTKSSNIPQKYIDFVGSLNGAETYKKI